MNFLSIDQHVAVCSDIRYIFNKLGHTVKEISLSGHAPLLGKPQGRIPILEGDGWCSTIHGKKFEEFYNTYKYQFEKYDGFICCYPPIFSMLYKYFHKPIIIQIPIRYECGADCNPELWQEFNRYLRTGVDSGQIYLCANSMYDKKYAEGFIKREVKYIPSLCEYTGMSYNPTIDQFLYYSSFNISDQSGRMIKKHDALQGGHAWQCVADYKGCIHYPYNISTMSIFEQYTANIPVFFPTRRYLMEMWLNKLDVLHQISWQQQVNHGKSHSLIKHDFEYDPNNFADFNCVSNWLQYADYYYGDMKHIEYFDNKEERDEILSYSNKKLLEISSLMSANNKLRKSKVYNAWSNILKDIA